MPRIITVKQPNIMKVGGTKRRGIMPHREGHGFTLKIIRRSRKANEGTRQK